MQSRRIFKANGIPVVHKPKNANKIDNSTLVWGTHSVLSALSLKTRLKYDKLYICTKQYSQIYGFLYNNNIFNKFSNLFAQEYNNNNTSVPIKNKKPNPMLLEIILACYEINKLNSNIINTPFIIPIERENLNN